MTWNLTSGPGIPAVASLALSSHSLTCADVRGPVGAGCAPEVTGWSSSSYRTNGRPGGMLQRLWPTPVVDTHHWICAHMRRLQHLISPSLGISSGQHGDPSQQEAEGTALRSPADVLPGPTCADGSPASKQQMAQASCLFQALQHSCCAWAAAPQPTWVMSPRLPAAAPAHLQPLWSRPLLSAAWRSCMQRAEGAGWCLHAVCG